MKCEILLRLTAAALITFSVRTDSVRAGYAAAGLLPHHYIQPIYKSSRAQESAPIFVVQQGPPKWLPLSAENSYVKGILNPDQLETMLKTYGVGSEDIQKLRSGDTGVGLEAVLHAKGSKFNELTLKGAAEWLNKDQGHGTMFEQMVAKNKTAQGCQVEFTGAGNLSTDLRVCFKNQKLAGFLGNLIGLADQKRMKLQ